MLDRAQAIAFDVDAASLISLREALPNWDIKDVNGMTATSLANDWTPGAAELLIVGVTRDFEDTLGLCRFLAIRSAYSEDFQQGETASLGAGDSRPNQAGRPDAPLLVLVPLGQEPLVAKLLKAGAHSCLMLPINAKDVASMLVRARAGNRPGRHTLNLEQAQSEDRWRDDGGQG
jgi:hypothetical protein